MFVKHDLGGFDELEWYRFMELLIQGKLRNYNHKH